MSARVKAYDDRDCAPGSAPSPPPLGLDTWTVEACRLSPLLSCRSPLPGLAGPDTPLGSAHLHHPPAPARRLRGTRISAAPEPCRTGSRTLCMNAHPSARRLRSAYAPPRTGAMPRNAVINPAGPPPYHTRPAVLPAAAIRRCLTAAASPSSATRPCTS